MHKQEIDNLKWRLSLLDEQDMTPGRMTALKNTLKTDFEELGADLIYSDHTPIEHRRIMVNLMTDILNALTRK